MRVAALCVALMVGCGAPAAQQSDDRTIPDPLFTTKLPDPPEDVPTDKRIVLPVSKCVVEGSEPPEETPPGIYMTQELAGRAARTKVAYDEIRGLYEVDLRTMDREREVYQKQLDLADHEVAEWREKARRTWWEQNQGWFGLGIGLVVGAGLAVGIAAAFDGTLGATE
jgi:hypothetical protein